MFPAFVAAALAGSATGGASAYAVGSAFPGVVHHLPLVTPRMVAAAHGWLSTEGVHGLNHQAWSGVPYKTFAYQAAHANISFGAFVVQAVFVRGLRFLEIGVILGIIGRAGRRAAPRLYGAFTVLVLTFFTAGLTRVVMHWS